MFATVSQAQRVLAEPLPLPLPVSTASVHLQQVLQLPCVALQRPVTLAQVGQALAVSPRPLLASTPHVVTLSATLFKLATLPLLPAQHSSRALLVLTLLLHKLPLVVPVPQVVLLSSLLLAHRISVPATLQSRPVQE